MENTLKQLFVGVSLNPNSIKQILKTEPELTKWLNIKLAQNRNYESIGKLVICLVKDITLDKCDVCGKELSYTKTVNGKIHKFCSNKCKLSKEANPFSRSEVKEKIKQTLLEKYGVDNITKSEIYKQRVKENVFSKEIVKEKIKQTLLEKYGVEHVSQDAEIQMKMRKGKLKTAFKKIADKYKGVYEPNFKLSQFMGSGKTYSWKCVKCGNIFNAIYDDGKIHSRCFNCFPRKRVVTSKLEKDLVNFLKQYFPDLKENDRTLITPKELDIVIPSKKIAIEFNGSYWHSTEIKRDKNYHLNKTLACENVGYRLIHLYEHDWKQKSEILKNKLKNILGIEQERIFARKCVVKEISTQLKNNFLNNNHIQGEDKSTIKLGLFNKDELVAVMSFCKPRFNKNYEWELSRYATSKHVIGGAGKLLKYFECKYLPKSIITYADRSYSQGNLYNQLGFNFLYLSEPNYIWSNGKEIYLRYQCLKKKLHNILKENFKSELSESENMKANGFYQIFNCGNLVFEKIYE